MTPVDPNVADPAATALAAYPMFQREPPPRRWLVVLVVAWILVLVAGLGWALLHSEPTDREQTTVAGAQGTVDAATARLATAAGADGGAVVSISDFQKVGDCRVTVFRSGQRFDRVVTALVPSGEEGALLERVAGRLPADFHASRIGGPHAMLFADAGDFVRVVGSVAQAGLVQFVVDTGSCRPLGDLAPSAGGDGDRALLAPVLSKLDLTGPRWHAYQVPCPNGGTLSTVEAIGPDGVVVGAKDLRLALDGLGAAVVIGPETYAYRSGQTGIAARIQDRHLVVTATTVCPQ